MNQLDHLEQIQFLRENEETAREDREKKTRETDLNRDRLSPSARYLGREIVHSEENVDRAS